MTNRKIHPYFRAQSHTYPQLALYHRARQAVTVSFPKILPGYAHWRPCSRQLIAIPPLATFRCLPQTWSYVCQRKKSSIVESFTLDVQVGTFNCTNIPCDSCFQGKKRTHVAGTGKGVQIRQQCLIAWESPRLSLALIFSKRLEYHGRECKKHVLRRKQNSINCQESHNEEPCVAVDDNIIY